MEFSFIPFMHLVWQFAKRELRSKYRGSFLGYFWSLLSPLFLLVTYCVVFRFIFKSHYLAGRDETTFGFGLGLYCGNLVYTFFADSVLRSSQVILSHPNYVKKVRFPLEALPLAIVCSNAVQLALGFIPFFLVLPFVGVPFGLGSFTALGAFFPVILFTVATSIFMACLAPFVRDLTHVLSTGLTVLLFLSAVFYSIESLPGFLRRWIVWNPLATCIEGIRNALVFAKPADLGQFGWLALIAVLLAVGSHQLFRALSSTFADVL